jgi:hypothetical protein
MSRRQQILAEEIVSGSRFERYNRVLDELCNTHLEAQGLVNQYEGIIYIDFLEDPGSLEEYWQEARAWNRSAIERERKRLYEQQRIALEIIDAAEEPFYYMHCMLESLTPLPAEIEEWEGESFFKDYYGAWTCALCLPIWNRLYILHLCESFIWDDVSPPNEPLSEFIETQESDKGRGRPTSQRKWMNRKRLVVRLLLREKRLYTSPDDFFFDLAVEDPDWAGNASSVRRYFKDRLGGDRSPTTLDGWLKLAKWWRLELTVNIDTGWFPDVRP